MAVDFLRTLDDLELELKSLRDLQYKYLIMLHDVTSRIEILSPHILIRKIQNGKLEAVAGYSYSTTNSEIESIPPSKVLDAFNSMSRPGDHS